MTPRDGCCCICVHNDRLSAYCLWPAVKCPAVGEMREIRERRRGRGLWWSAGGQSGQSERGWSFLSTTETVREVVTLFKKRPYNTSVFLGTQNPIWTLQYNWFRFLPRDLIIDSGSAESAQTECGAWYSSSVLRLAILWPKEFPPDSAVPLSSAEPFGNLSPQRFGFTACGFVVLVQYHRYNERH